MTMRCVSFEVALKLDSFANGSHGHWTTKNARAKNHRGLTCLAWLRAGKPCFRLPVKVTITRIAPKKLDSDNLAISAKHVRDEVAKQLGVNDGDETRVLWAYDQERASKPNTYAVRVSIEELDLSVEETCRIANLVLAGITEDP